MLFEILDGNSKGSTCKEKTATTHYAQTGFPFLVSGKQGRSLLRASDLYLCRNSLLIFEAVDIAIRGRPRDLAYNRFESKRRRVFVRWYEKSDLIAFCALECDPVSIVSVD